MYVFWVWGFPPKASDKVMDTYTHEAKEISLNGYPICRSVCVSVRGFAPQNLTNRDIKMSEIVL